METEVKQTSNVVLIARFFDMKAHDAMVETRTLTEEDKAQLGEGIRSGTLTY